MKKIIRKISRLYRKPSFDGSFTDIVQWQPVEGPKDIYIIGNGASLHTIDPVMMQDKFTIGTNRSWLWSQTDILIWRDGRITEELEFFGVEKKDSLWLAGSRAFDPGSVSISPGTREAVDYVFTDDWKDTILGPGIKWNGIVFHALAVARYLSPEATIHLIGIDLTVSPESHHFFNHYPGFDQGFYKHAWEPENFNYQKRLDMMLRNFERLQKRGFTLVNHSAQSRLSDLFGYTPFT